MRPSRDRVYMRMAHELAERSTCVRRKVGCILAAADGRILSLGYNGVPHGEAHCTDEPCYGSTFESGKGLEFCNAIHAEQNALIRCTEPYEIDTAYCTTFPCAHCQKMLMNTYCARIVYTAPYYGRIHWNKVAKRL